MLLVRRLVVRLRCLLDVVIKKLWVRGFFIERGKEVKLEWV